MFLDSFIVRHRQWLWNMKVRMAWGISKLSSRATDNQWWNTRTKQATSLFFDWFSPLLLFYWQFTSQDNHIARAEGTKGVRAKAGENIFIFSCGRNRLYTRSTEDDSIRSSRTSNVFDVDSIKILLRTGAYKKESDPLLLTISLSRVVSNISFAFGSRVSCIDAATMAGASCVNDDADDD